MTPVTKPKPDFKNLAINQAIRQAVENWVNGNMAEANHCFEMAINFQDAPDELFNP